MRSTQSPKVKHLLQYAFTWILLRGGRILPYAVRIKSGGALLGLLIAKLRVSRNRIESNLEIVFPEISDERRQEISNGVSKNFGKTFVEILNNDTALKHPEYRHASGAGLEAVRNAQAAGTGVVFVSGHFGQWDAARLYLKGEGVDVGAVYRPSNNTLFDRLFVPQIENAGSPAFPSDRRGTLEMVRHVRAGGAVAILIDQHFHSGKRLDFLGHPARTSVAAASLALKYDVPMIPVYGRRRDDSLHVDIVFEAPIPPSDPLTMTQAANDSLAARVMADPGQWYWLHNRWV